jgi:hypothetical protein
MSALVRIFAHSGVTTAPVNAGAGRYTTDSVSLLKQPYLGRQSLTATTGAAQTTNDLLTANAGAKLLNVQIQAGKTVAIEVNPPNRNIEADSDSPYFSGDVTFEAGQNWKLSIKEIEVV